MRVSVACEKPVSLTAERDGPCFAMMEVGRNQLTMVSVLLTTWVIFWRLSCPFWKVSLTFS